MLKVKVDTDRSLFLTFNYERYDEPVGDPETGLPIIATTEALLFQDPEDIDPIVTGVARCSAKDIFTKVRGRKQALKRALAKLPLPVEARRSIWNSYFELVRDH